MTPETAKMSKFLIQTFDFGGHLSTYRAENTPKSRPLKVETNAQILPIQPLNNFEKVQKTTFLTPKMAKSRMSIWRKVSIFRSIFALRALKLPRLHPPNHPLIHPSIHTITHFQDLKNADTGL